MINGLQQLTANIEGLNSKINSIGKDSKGKLSEEFTKTAQSAKAAGQATNELQEKYKTLQKQVQEAATAADKAWQSGTGFSGAKKDFSEALNQLVAFKKELGTLSIGQEKGIYSSLARGLDTSGTSYKVLIDRIKALNAEQKKLAEGTKSPKTSENTSFGVFQGLPK